MCDKLQPEDGSTQARKSVGDHDGDGDRTVLSVCFVCVPHWLYSVMAVCGLRKHSHYVMLVVDETGLASVSTPPMRLRRHNTPDSCFETLTAFLHQSCTETSATQVTSRTINKP